MCAAQATETDQNDRGLPARSRSVPPSRVDDCFLGQGMVAFGGMPCRQSRHESSLDRVAGLGQRPPTVRPVSTRTETAGYDEYVRWCGRTGAVMPPPTRFCILGCQAFESKKQIEK